MNCLNLLPKDVYTLGMRLSGKFAWNRTRQSEKILRIMPKALKMPALSVTQEYIDQFKKADNTFKYQIVFDPLLKKLVPLNPYSADVDDVQELSYAGL